jgi:hypothetical protein
MFSSQHQHSARAISGTSLSAFSVVLIALLNACVQGSLAAQHASSAGCIRSGDESEINKALAGPNAHAVLCQNAVFRISHEIVVSADGQELYTASSPNADGRARIEVADSNLSTAIFSRASNISIHHVIIDGARPLLGRDPKGGALIEIGGDVTGIQVDHVRAYDPRGWSVLHVFEGGRKCSGARISDNDLGPSGHPNGEWADGISFACRNSLVEHNTITDASDGAIVIFGAPGTLVDHNLVVTRSNTLLGGINLVDYKPFDGDYTGVIVRDNRIEALGGYIKVGIAAGPSVWTDDVQLVNHGATISNNTLSGANFGYGIAVQGVTDFKILSNKAVGHFAGNKGPRCHATTAPIGGPFIRNFLMTTGTFQKDFVAGTLTYSICIEKSEAASD